VEIEGIRLGANFGGTEGVEGGRRRLFAM